MKYVIQLLVIKCVEKKIDSSHGLITNMHLGPYGPILTLLRTIHIIHD